MDRTRIGDDRQEAIDWLQDRLSLTRPLAERAMIALLHEGAAITTEQGIHLTESEEEVDRRAKSTSATQARQGARLHFRNHNRSSTSQTKRNRRGKLVKTDFSEEAEQMMFGSSYTPPED